MSKIILINEGKKIYPPFDEIGKKRSIVYINISNIVLKYVEINDINDFYSIKKFIQLIELSIYKQMCKHLTYDPENFELIDEAKNYYLTFSTKIIRNLDKNNSLKNDKLLPELLHIFKNEENKLEKILEKISEIDLLPERNKKYFDIINADITKVEGRFITGKCEKCKGTQFRLYSIQERSADEGASDFMVCVSCGNQIKLR